MRHYGLHAYGLLVCVARGAAAAQGLTPVAAAAVLLTAFSGVPAQPQPAPSVLDTSAWTLEWTMTAKSHRASQPETGELAEAEALTAKGDALVELERKEEAAQCYRDALDLFYRQNPDPEEPPVGLMRKLQSLAGAELGTGSQPEPAEP
jgi:hypothetical protein